MTTSSSLTPPALYYDDTAYRETLKKTAARPGRPAGLMGREVAGREFLDAYFTHGQWTELVALTPNDASSESLKQLCVNHPSSRQRQRRLKLFSVAEFHETFLPRPPAPGLYLPWPPDPRYAWARLQGPSHGFALSGVTHTLSTARAVEVLRSLVVAPWQSYDRLICTSRAVAGMVDAVTGAFAEYLQKQHGGTPRRRIALEIIPLGVNVDRFRPPTAEERTAQRRRLGIADDELAVLFVGRLSHHAKAHPFPMYRGLERAVRTTQKKVRLLLVGWTPNAAVERGFLETARAVAPGVPVSILDGLDEENRFGAWRAADVFCSLSDNIQETFGLVIVEAMASGLPVVASDWNGYRDLVEHESTGFLVPTSMVPGATADLTGRLILGSMNYDHFLAHASQCVSVDCDATARAFIRLFEDPDLRRRMGEAGRRRAVEHFSWRGVVRAYEELWRVQDEERRSCAAGETSGTAPRFPIYPAPEATFVGYPTRWLDPDTVVVADRDAPARLATLGQLPLTSHEAQLRCTDAGLLSKLLQQARAGCRLQELLQQLIDAGTQSMRAHATLAWLLKYDLLRRQPESGSDHG